MVEEVVGLRRPRSWLDVAELTGAANAPSPRLRRMCERRIRGEPLQYVLGAWSFLGLDLHRRSRGC